MPLQLVPGAAVGEVAVTEDAGIVSGNASRCYQQPGENISRELSVLEIDIVLAHLNSPVDTEQAHPSAVAVAMMTHIDFVGMLSIVDLVSLVSRPALSILRLATLGRCPSKPARMPLRPCCL
jgi:hypothetical protein